MKNFYTALMTKFNATVAGSHSSFYTDVGGRLYQGEAPENTTYPYCVFKHINNNQIDTFKNEMDDIIIQFSIFSEKSSSVEVHDAMSDLKTLFNDCVLSVSGGTCVSFYRLNDGLQREEITTITANGKNRSLSGRKCNKRRTTKKLKYCIP